MPDSCYEKSKNGIYIRVKVVAKSSRSEVCGVVGHRIKVTVTAAPRNGEANRALEEVLAKFFAIPKSCCSVVSGHKTSLKTVFIATDVEDQIRAKFQLSL